MSGDQDTIRWLQEQADKVLASPQLTPQDVAITVLLQRLIEVVAALDARLTGDGK
jgi:hypothetical protein